MYILGDKYDIPHLRSATLQQIKAKLGTGKETEESLSLAAAVTYQATEATTAIRKALAAEIVRGKTWRDNETLFAGVTDQAAFTSDLAHEMQERLDKFEDDAAKRGAYPKAICKNCGLIVVIEMSNMEKFSMKNWRCPDWFCDCDSQGEIAMEWEDIVLAHAAAAANASS